MDQAPICSLTLPFQANCHSEARRCGYMQEEEEEEKMEYKNVRTKEEHGSMEAGGSTLPNWGMYPQKPYLCAVCAKSQLAPSRMLYSSSTVEFVCLYCGVKLAD